MPDGTFATPDLTTFCRLDGLGFVVTGQRIEADRRSWRAGSLRNDGASGGDLHHATRDRVDEPTIAQAAVRESSTTSRQSWPCPPRCRVETTVALTSEVSSSTRSTTGDPPHVGTTSWRALAPDPTADTISVSLRRSIPRVTTRTSPTAMRATTPTARKGGTLGTLALSIACSFALPETQSESIPRSVDSTLIGLRVERQQEGGSWFVPSKVIGAPPAKSWTTLCAPPSRSAWPRYRSRPRRRSRPS